MPVFLTASKPRSRNNILFESIICIEEVTITIKSSYMTSSCDLSPNQHAVRQGCWPQELPGGCLRVPVQEPARLHLGTRL